MNGVLVTEEQKTAAHALRSEDPLAPPASSLLSNIPEIEQKPEAAVSQLVDELLAAPAKPEPPEQQRAPAKTAASGKPVIVFDRLTKVYPAQPNRPALSNISLSIYSGEFIFLVGHSGSGKSTFIRLINRELVATSGKLIVAGEDLVKLRNWRVPYLRRNIGCVFQDFKLLPNKTAFQNVAFALEVIGKSKHIIRTQVPEVLRLVGLEDKLNAYPDQLSGGEQQRVSIARAIVNRPPLLICDEPTGNLDPQTSLGIMRLLDRINRTGTTILVATHDREMVDSLRKRVIALENGYLVRDVEKGVYGLDA
jgi:cell division transport system ATP-binding protein